MEFLVVAIKDKATERFMQPIFVETRQAAVRWFNHIITTTEMFKDNPQDFELWQLGTFDDKLGIYGTGDNDLITKGKEQ